MSRSRWLILALFLAGLAQLLFYLPRLPDRLATHYNAAGVPNGWMSRRAAAEFQLALLGGLAAVFAVLPALLLGMPGARVNLPHREYWLAPERRATSLASIRSRLEVMGAAALALVIGISELMFRANLGARPELSLAPVLALLGAFAGTVAVWSILFFRRFSRPPGR